LISTNIAISMQRESLSLKTLSLVTMFFLPWTFVATLFSSPLLNWNQDQSKSTEKTVDGWFWIYWAVTIPLTLLNFEIWGVWTFILGRKQGP
jgi:hypothetical protein